MSCNQCFTKFNFFHKEVGCANCGLSFCSKCLKQKAKIPSKGSGEFSVCKMCYTKLTPSSSNTQVIMPPPEAYLKRLELLENPSAPPITIYKEDQKYQKLRSGLSAADQSLLDRLEKLKADKHKKPPPSEVEIRERLARLKGENDYVEGPSGKSNLPPVDNRSDQQKVDSMLEQFVNEREIQLAHNAEDEIEARIATLREKGIRPNEGTYVSNLHDDGSDEEVDKITKKIMDEVALDERNPLPPTTSTDKKKQSPTSSANESDEFRSTSPELPWCVLCNKDAQVRCLDCGNDLYCNKCNSEVHKTWGDTDHRVVPYEKK